MEDLFRFADELGPRKLVHVTDPAVGLRAVVAIDNTACGPAIGGVRMAPDVSAEEAFRLARAMTLKNAAAGLAHGGGKSVIFADPAQRERKEALVRAFARAIRDLVEYVPGPDMGTDERCMGWVFDEIGRAVGLPPELGGIPLDEIGATGFGLWACAKEAEAQGVLSLAGARVAVQGFGAVGRHAARFLAREGALLVAAADSHGTLHAPKGIDLEKLCALKQRGGSVLDYEGGEKLGRDDVLGVPCEIWIPAARPDVVRAENQARLSARLVLQGANIPCTPEAEAALHARGVVCVPDFIANAGGVICAAVEYHGGTRRAAFEAIEEKIRENTRRVLEESRRAAQAPRAVAAALATARVRAAQAYRKR